MPMQMMKESEVAVLIACIWFWQQPSCNEPSLGCQEMSKEMLPMEKP